jgi:A/G-specific adenine glycosylase
LLRWFGLHKRDLPWRRTRDPYAIWISEIMLQQTRVAAVIPYFEKFVARFPNYAALADAPEEDVLTHWAGLGYYSRARNLQKAARQMVALGAFPPEHAAIRQLSGIGDYTAGAVASIAFGQPHTAIDGNVRRVVVRLAGDAEANIGEEAARLLDRRCPGDWNQAVMELGALICVPKTPNCEACPVARLCGARRAGLERELPLQRPKPKLVRKERTLLLIRKKGQVLLIPSPRVAGFWDLPEPFSSVRLGAKLGAFRHAITTSQYLFEVREAKCEQVPEDGRWFAVSALKESPLSTASKKALACLEKL